MRILLPAALAAGLGSAQAGASVLSGLYSGLFFFGDSLSDTGNLSPFPPFPYFGNQFSNGPVHADLLDDDFASTATGNYAYGGAAASGGSLPDFDDQISLFGLDLLDGDPQPGPNPLAGVWFGANDMFAVLDTIGADLVANNPLAEAVAASAIGSATMAIRDGISRLNNDFGISEFLVLNLPDLGATPKYNGNSALAAEARALTMDFNAALGVQIGGLGAGITVTSIDVFALFDDLLAGSVLPDLTNLTESCLSAVFIPCSDPDSYLFWDNVHPTAVVHAELARQIEAAYAPPVPVPPALPLLAGGLLALAWTGRRRTRAVTPQ